MSYLKSITLGLLGAAVTIVLSLFCIIVIIIAGFMGEIKEVDI